MIIVDTALRAREAAGNPVRVALIGAGFMARGIAHQIVNTVPGMRLCAIANRHRDAAARAYRDAGLEHATPVSRPGELEDAIRGGAAVVTDDALLLCRAEGIEALIEATGAVDFGARVATEAIRHGKHVVLMNAELEGTLGPILKVQADRAGCIVSGCDGDQPGVQMNLHRFVTGIGLSPLVCGNIKGLQDRYRNPTTQEGFARKWGQNPRMVTSFADGTKVSFEQAVVANATGMCVEQRGMRGGDFEGHVDELCRAGRYDPDRLRKLGGVVDYVVKARPSPGVFVLATHDDPRQRHYLNLYKLGEGPLYSFYTPYHLCHLEAPLSLARAVLFNDAVTSATFGCRVDVVATAKTDLRAGEVLDGIGGYGTYGQCENAEVAVGARLLPMGLAEGCTLRRDLPRDAVLTYDDVKTPEGRLCDRLRREQDRHFFG
ncbi:MAG TPA: SAF domain-containing protein [Methylomirabilota bacterium]|jgi:predicted homoserine dehydrogenase-like protein